MARSPIDQYINTQVETSTPLERVVLLCNAAIRFLAAAEQELVEGRLDLASADLIRSQRIVLALITTLDIEQGAALAATLRELYAFFYASLVRANVEKDASLVSTVRGMLDELRSGWLRAQDGADGAGTLVGVAHGRTA